MGSGGAVAAGGPVFDELKAAGNAAFMAGDFAGAIATFTEGLALDPSSHVLYSNRSAAKAGAGDLRGAAADARCCVALAPRWPRGHARRALAAFRSGDYATAAAAYARAVELDPYNDSHAEAAEQASECAKKQTEAMDSAMRGRWERMKEEQALAWEDFEESYPKVAMCYGRAQTACAAVCASVGTLLAALLGKALKPAWERARHWVVVPAYEKLGAPALARMSSAWEACEYAFVAQVLPVYRSHVGPALDKVWTQALVPLWREVLVPVWADKLVPFFETQAVPRAQAAYAAAWRTIRDLKEGNAAEAAQSKGD